MDDWSNKSWHKAVRYKLKEQKTFFRVQLRPYDISGTVRTIEKFRTANQVEGLEAHLIFGSFDFLLSGWMHPLVAKEIPAKLAGVLQTSQVPQEFVVEDGDGGLDHLTNRQKALLDTVLSVHVIRGVQRDGRKHRLFADLEANKLIMDRDSYSKQMLSFYSTVTMQEFRKNALDGILEDIDRYVSQTETIVGTTIHRGHGFCHLLVESHVSPANYFTIGTFTKTLVDICRRSEARVETYLPCDPFPMIRPDPRIHDSTFSALKGGDPLVQTIIPEAYAVISQTADDIVQFLVQKAGSVVLTVKAKSLLREVLRPVLADDEAAAATALFVFFTQVEAFLKKNQGRFLANLQLIPKDVYNQCGIKNPVDRMTIGDRLQVYAFALNQSDSPGKNLLGNWEPVVRLRNDISHGQYSLSDWPRATIVILEHHSWLDSLIAFISKALGESYSLTYLGE